MAAPGHTNRFENIFKRYEIDDKTGCWIFTGSLYHDGYGRVRINGKLYAAHRASWIAVHGEIPKGICVLHKCDNPSCIRPDHLFAGTHQDNMDDMKNKKRQTFGEKNPGSKLSSQAVSKIREEYRGGSKITSLAEKYHVSTTCIKDIIKGETWKYI